MNSKEMTVVFPCHVGDTVYSFEWNPQKARYGIVQAECLGFNVRSETGYEILLKGAGFEYLRSSSQYRDNWFVTAEEADEKLKRLNGEETDG